MKRLAAVVITFISVTAMGQSTELYFGSSLSRYDWTPNYSLANNVEFQKGFQTGIMWGPKAKNFLGIRRIIEPHIGLEYNTFRIYTYRRVTDQSSTASWAQVHKARLGLPTRLRFKRLANKHLELFVLADPGVDMTIIQDYVRWDDNPGIINTIDFSMNAGLGMYLNLVPDKPKSSGYKFAGFTFSAMKRLEYGPSANAEIGVGELDQFMFNAGVRFTYVKSKKIWRLFSR